MLIHSHEGEDTILLVSNEVADALEQFVCEGNNVALRRYRAKAYYSLDCGDGIEHHIPKCMCPVLLPLYILLLTS